MKIVRVTKAIEGVIGKFNITRCMTDMYYKTTVDNEISLGTIKKQDRVLCIGGGPYPATAINIHRKTGAKVTVIDNDLNCVKTAIGVIKSLGLCKQIEVMYSSVEEIEIKKFSIVHVALQVEPKEKVTQEIVKRSASNTRILLRLPKEKLRFLYDHSGSVAEQQHRMTTHSKFCNTGKTVLIVPQETAVLSIERDEFMSLAI